MWWHWGEKKRRKNLFFKKILLRIITQPQQNQEVSVSSVTCTVKYAAI
jgi:hypothetical protein